MQVADPSRQDACDTGEVSQYQEAEKKEYCLIVSFNALNRRWRRAVRQVNPNVFNGVLRSPVFVYIQKLRVLD